MKQKIVRRASALVLAGCLLAGAALPALAASAKEEVIYANLDASGTVTGVYAVNSFAVQAGDTVTDHGSYTAVRNMTTTDPLEHSGDTVTAAVAEDGKLYYEGTMDTATALPWLVKLTYTLDGAEIAPEELGGKSGALAIRLQVSRNPDCTGDFFDQYALQVTMTLDTDRAQNIVADGATMANVGSNKQLSYILLPGSDSDVTVTADVTDFAMNAISLNGVKLRLNFGLDGADLTGMLDRLQSGSVQLDDGANALADGIAQVQAGLDTLNGKSGELTGGSAKVKAALTQMQTALNGVSASTDQLTTLLDASTQIQNGIARLDAGAAQLDEQVSYDAYKAILKENGLDLDQLKDGNAKAMEQLEQLARVMPQLKDVILLLKGSSANIDAMETYLNTVHDGVAQLHAGSSTLNSQYGQFDAGVRQLANALTGMLDNLSVLTDGVNQLASRYGQLDSGLNAYTDGVAQLKAGVQQLTDGAAQLTAGTGELRSNVSGIDMGDQLDSLLAGLNGSSEVESFTSAENTDVSAVQFALQTVAIEAPAPAAEPEAAPVALTFWQKLLKLFGLYKGKTNSLSKEQDRPARGLPDPALISYLLKMILHQLAVADAGQGVFFVGHVVEVGLHHPGDAVVGHQQVGLVRLVPQFVQQVVDALGQLQHALAAVVAVGKAGFGNAELLAVAGCALVLAKALLPQARLTPGGDAGGIGDGFCRVGGAGQGRIQDFVDGIAAGLYLLAQGPGLRPAPLGEGTVGHAADLVFHVPHGLAVAGKIQLVHGSSLLGLFVGAQFVPDRIAEVRDVTCQMVSGQPVQKVVNALVTKSMSLVVFVEDIAPVAAQNGAECFQRGTMDQKEHVPHGKVEYKAGAQAGAEQLFCAAGWETLHGFVCKSPLQKGGVIGVGLFQKSGDLIFRKAKKTQSVIQVHKVLLTCSSPLRSPGCGHRKSRWRGWACRTFWPGRAPHRQIPPPRWDALPARPAACWACRPG